MADFQETTASDVVAHQPKRRFTLEEANRALPLVQRVAGDIVESHKSARQLHAKLESRISREERGEVETELERTLGRLQSFVDELGDIGVELKDYETGLIDFVARYGDRDIFLCWKLGEESIGYWHEVRDGFAGRQPISQLDDKA